MINHVTVEDLELVFVCAAVIAAAAGVASVLLARKETVGLGKNIFSKTNWCFGLCRALPDLAMSSRVVCSTYG
jgi:hypothetical protein